MPVAPEFSRLLAADGVPPGGLTVNLEATVEERRALARRFDLVSLDRLDGEMRLERAGEDLLHVTGQVRAALAQRCVVTLEPVPAVIDATFERLFSRSEPVEAQGEVEIDPEAELPEPIPSQGLDLGELLAEELALALDPYPRAADADAHLAQLGGAEDETHPFAALATLKKR